MSKKPSILLASGFVFVLAMIFWGAPADARPTGCASECTCSSSCAQTCDEIDGPSTCGLWGVCKTSSSCINCLDGSGGNDSLVGTFGNDGIVSFVGDDTLWNRSGNDDANGGSGDDALKGEGDEEDESQRSMVSE